MKKLLIYGVWGMAVAIGGTGVFAQVPMSMPVPMPPLTPQATAEAMAKSEQIKQEERAIFRRLGRVPEVFEPLRSESGQPVVLQKVELSADRTILKLHFNANAAHFSMRTGRIEEWKREVRKKLGAQYRGVGIQFYVYKQVLFDELIPNYYRPRAQRDAERASSPVNRRPWVRPIDRATYGQGLSGRHIALWGGHGRLYHGTDSAWLWQRPALFGTIEDLNTAEYVNRYLAPMLENAGAVVVMPRERDFQTHEVIVDADHSTGGGRVELIGEWTTAPGGFRWMDTLRAEENPFRAGSYLQARLVAVSDAAVAEGLVRRPEVVYHLGLSGAGHYGVYVSWHAAAGNLTNARYTVHHRGGESAFEVNQTIGGGTWVWLGSFDLDRDSRVVLQAPQGVRSGRLTADAVKIGGGMGHVLRGYDSVHQSVSGVPRYAEAMRYWMQYSGISPHIYAQDTRSSENADSLQLDYSDSFKATGDWCTYLKTDRRIPLDVAIGLHTDAGICDSIIGTLSIHFTQQATAKYENQKSKLAARDFADLVQTQVVNDIRAKYTPHWTRRAMYDKSYAEISRPDMPAMLIELFSHQNAGDVALANDPEFRFDISRAIYKGILRFLADRYGTRVVVQPLPPQSVQAEFLPGDSVRVSWAETIDPLERSARPNRYKVYRRVGADGSGFDGGTQVRGTELLLPCPRDGQVYSYRVTALNEGGESFPSETVALGLVPAAQEQGRALVVNGFTRLSGPAIVRDPEGRALGFNFREELGGDPGVPYISDRSVVGAQVDFNPLSPFVDNANPGWGASGEELLFTEIAGNTFDYAARHGEGLLRAGYSFVSCSRGAFETMPLRPSQYGVVDVIMGRQRGYPTERYAVYTPAMVGQLEGVVEAGLRLVISGSYIRTDTSYTPAVEELLGTEGITTIPAPLEQASAAQLAEFFTRLLGPR